MRGIMGYNPPARGSIHFDGRDITGQPVYANVRQGIGFVPEDRRIFPELTVMENLEVAILLTEQNAHFALGIADRGYVIDKGRVCYEGMAEELADNEEIQQRYLAV